MEGNTIEKKREKKRWECGEGWRDAAVVGWEDRKNGSGKAGDERGEVKGTGDKEWEEAISAVWRKNRVQTQREASCTAPFRRGGHTTGQVRGGRHRLLGMKKVLHMGWRKKMIHMCRKDSVWPAEKKRTSKRLQEKIFCFP